MTRSPAHLRRQVVFDTAKYIAVGLIVYVVDLATFALLAEGAGVHYLAANTAAKVTGAASGFLLHKHVTFAGPQEASALRQAPQYVALLVFSVVLGNTLTYLAVDVASMNEVAGKVAADAIVIANAFLVSRAVIFRRSTDAGG